MKAAAIALVLVLAGCERPEVKAAHMDQPSVYRDAATGCEYLGPAMTPRIATDGHSHMGCGK